MFHRLSAAIVYIFVMFTVLAVAVPTGNPPPTNQCSTGSIECCNSVQSANANGVSTLLGLLGVVVQDVTAMVGLSCTSITGIGLAGNSCKSQVACCTGNNMNGLIVLGCNPINIL